MFLTIFFNLYAYLLVNESLAIKLCPIHKNIQIRKIFLYFYTSFILCWPEKQFNVLKIITMYTKFTLWKTVIACIQMNHCHFPSLEYPHLIVLLSYWFLHLAHFHLSFLWCLKRKLLLFWCQLCILQPLHWFVSSPFTSFLLSEGWQKHLNLYRPT